MSIQLKRKTTMLALLAFLALSLLPAFSSLNVGGVEAQASTPSTVWSEFSSFEPQLLVNYPSAGYLTWNTTFGLYTMDKKPYIMSFTDRYGVQQISQSMFWINTTDTDKPLNPDKISGNYMVLVQNDTCFQIKYAVTTDKETVGWLTVTYNFFKDSKPKISVHYESMNLTTFNIVWVLLPTKNYVKTSEYEVVAIPETNMTKVKETVFKEDKKCEVGCSANPAEWTGSWSLIVWDDVEGVCVLYVGAEKVFGGKGITITFPANAVEIDPSVVGTSSNYYSLETTFERKTFYAKGRFWLIYLDSGDYYYQTSVNGENWTSRTYLADGYMLDVYVENGEYIHYSRTADTEGLKYRKGLLNGNGTITWLAPEQTVASGYWTGATSITVDSEGHPWIAYAVIFQRADNDRDCYARVTTSTLTNGTWQTRDGFPFDLYYELASYPNIYYYPADVISLTGGKVYVVYWVNNELHGRLWDGSSFGSEETIVTDCRGYRSDGGHIAVSMVSVGDTTHMVYLDTSNVLHYMNRTTSWGSTVNLQTVNATSYPVLSLNSSSNDLICFWVGNGSQAGNNHIFYKKCVGGTWDSSATDWIDESAEEITIAYDQLYMITSSYSDEHVIGLAYQTGTASPYNIKFAFLGTIPVTIGEFQAPSIAYANKYFYLNATIKNAGGVADFVNATVELNGTIILKWVNSTNTFSEYSDPNNYCTLDASGSIKTQLNDTAYKLSWKIKLYWNYTEGSIFIISSNTKVFDSSGASGSGSTTSLFTFEDDLIIHTDATVDDDRVNPSQSITFTASIYYEGTSTVPEDVTGITAYVELNGVQKGSDTDVTGGLSITVTAESDVGNYSYNIYCVTDESSVQNQTVYVVVDRGVITISANTTSPAPNTYVDFTLTAIYDYDDQPITSWTVNTLRNNTHFATGNFTDGGYTDTLYIYTVENFTETTYGLTAFTSNTLTVYWSAYVALTVKTVDLDSETLTDAIVDFNGTEITVDSNGLAIKSEITKYDNITVKVKWHGVWVNGTWTVNMTETKTITATCNVWTLTVLAKDNEGNMLTASPTEFHITLPNGTYMSTTRTDGVYEFKVMNGTSHFRVKFQDQWVSTNLTVPMTSKNVTVVNINCWVYSLTVYVQSTTNSYQPNSPIVGASLTLYRTTDNKTLNGLYGLPANPQTQSYNSTHAVYTWPQLANQTSSYTVTATYGSQSSSTTTSLTQNTQIEIELYVPAPAQYYPPAPIPTTYTLTILVTKLDQPAANLKIEIYINNLQVASGQTDPQGKYTVNLTPGTYKIIIHLNGETKTETVNLTEPKTLQITIPAAPTPTIERFLRMSVILIIVMVGMVIVPKVVKRR